jgi:hypothetical protein
MPLLWFDRDRNMSTSNITSNNAAHTANATANPMMYDGRPSSVLIYLVLFAFFIKKTKILMKGQLFANYIGVLETGGNSIYTIKHRFRKNKINIELYTIVVCKEDGIGEGWKGVPITMFVAVKVVGVVVVVVVVVGTGVYN